MIQKLRDWLIEPSVRSLDPNGPDVTMAHRRILQTKPMLRQLFEFFYRQCRSMDERYFGNTPGKRLEIGSGSSFMKSLYPDVITSDIKPLPFVDMVFRAERIPFPDESVRAIYAINVFHHLPDPRAFFRELLRVLRPQGGVVMIEPYYGSLARWLFKRMHTAEDYDPDALAWETAECIGPGRGANQALSYIVLRRDRAIFEREFSGLKILVDKPHTHLLYLISGGVNFRQLAPKCLTPLVKCAEYLLSPLNSWIALQHTIVLRKSK